MKLITLSDFIYQLPQNLALKLPSVGHMFTHTHTHTHTHKAGTEGKLSGSRTKARFSSFYLS